MIDECFIQLFVSLQSNKQYTSMKNVSNFPESASVIL